MNNIKKLRTGAKMTQSVLAGKMGVSRSTIAMWETEASQPDNDMLKKLSEVLNSSIDYILGVTETEKKEKPPENINEPEKSPRRLYLEEQLRDVKFALLKESGDDSDELTDDQLEEIVSLIHYVKSKKEFRPKFMDWKDPK